MRHLIYILWVLLLTSCGTTYQISTLNYDPIYGPDGTEIKVDVVENEFELARKFRTDDKFRWDFAQFAMKQDLRWNYDFYFNNRMYRSPYASPFDFIGIHITIGGIGQLIHISIWDSIIGIDLDSMDMVVLLDIMDSIDMVGMDMVHLGMIGDTDRE